MIKVADKNEDEKKMETVMSIEKLEEQQATTWNMPRKMNRESFVVHEFQEMMGNRSMNMEIY